MIWVIWLCRKLANDPRIAILVCKIMIILINFHHLCIIFAGHRDHDPSSHGWSAGSGGRHQGPHVFLGPAGSRFCPKWGCLTNQKGRISRDNVNPQVEAQQILQIHENIVRWATKNIHPKWASWIMLNRRSYSSVYWGCTLVCPTLNGNGILQLFSWLAVLSQNSLTVWGQAKTRTPFEKTSCVTTSCLPKRLTKTWIVWAVLRHFAHMCTSLACTGEGIWLDRPGVKLSWYPVGRTKFWVGTEGCGLACFLLRELVALAVKVIQLADASDLKAGSVWIFGSWILQTLRPGRCR